MKKLPEISVVIPAYNEEKFIESCLRSVLKQKTKCNYEIIVVDNSSKDNTRKIVSEYGVKLVLEKKPGAAVARNAGAVLAKSEILYFLDADCRLPRGQIEKIYQAFLMDPSLSVLAGAYVYDQDGLIPYFITGTLNYFYYYHKLIKLIFKINTFSGGNLAIKKKVFEEIEGFNEKIARQDIVLPDDLDLAVRLHQNGAKKVLFSRDYNVFSSFRRVKRSPIKHGLIRLAATVKIFAGFVGKKKSE